jgi:hypothetical protein
MKTRPGAGVTTGATCSCVFFFTFKRFKRFKRLQQSFSAKRLSASPPLFFLMYTLRARMRQYVTRSRARMKATMGRTRE